MINLEEFIDWSIFYVLVAGVSIGFSPLIVCVLQKCVKLLTVSKSLTFPEKSAISLYVSATLKYLLQTQVTIHLQIYSIYTLPCNRLRYQYLFCVLIIVGRFKTTLMFGGVSFV